KIKNALFRECWTRAYELQRHRHACVSLGVASCQSEILSLKKAVWRLWLVSKSRTKSSAEGCEQLLRRAASVARPPSSPSQARSSNSDLNSQNGGLVKDLPEGMSDEFAPRRHSQAGLDGHVPPLDIPGFAQTLAECGREWRVGRGRPAVKEADDR